MSVIRKIGVLFAKRTVEGTEEFAFGFEPDPSKHPFGYLFGSPKTGRPYETEEAMVATAAAGELSWGSANDLASAVGQDGWEEFARTELAEVYVADGADDGEEWVPKT